MITLEELAPGTLKITASDKLDAEDFHHLGPKVDAIIDRHGPVRLLIDASHLEGWDNLAALQTHATFVKEHQHKVARIAVIARQEWQRWLVGAVKVFLHPALKLFEPGRDSEALQWLAGIPANHDGLSIPSGAGERLETVVADVVDGRR